jgi:hypothetical protein
LRKILLKMGEKFLPKLAVKGINGMTSAFDSVKPPLMAAGLVNGVLLLLSCLTFREGAGSEAAGHMDEMR